MKIEEIDCKPNTEKYQEQQSIALAHEQKENVSDGSLSMVAATDAAAEAAAPTTTPSSTTATTTTARNEMTDERNNNNNNNNNTSNSNKKKKSNHNDHIITEAAKIVLKNGLNGTTTTAATAATALLTAAAATVINLPPPPPPLPAHANIALYGAYPGMVAAPSAPFGFSISNGKSTSIGNSVTDAALNPHQLHVVSNSVSASTTTSSAISSTAIADEMPAATLPQTTKEQSSSECLNLGPSKISSCGSIDGRGGDGGGSASKADNVGVIDYTLGPKNNNNSNCNSHHSDIGRHPISASNEMPRGQSYGGRLQFFKDGKFILELARSKDNEKGGWVSVPRKIFRTPSSATSSTITPTSNTSTTYPKNESSTSLSFSDDNSSIQSSPWQRDHCWKQATPRCGISKEMSLFYQRPNKLILSAVGLKVSRRKRRRPFDNSFPSSLENIFMTLEPMENGIKSDKDSHRICSEVKGNCVNNSEDDTCSSSSTGTLTGADCTDSTIMNQTSTHTPKSSSMSGELIMEEHKSNARKQIVKDDTMVATEMTNGDHTISAKETSSEGMNTSENENNDDTPISLTVGEVKDETTKETINGDVKIENDFVAPSSLIKDSGQVAKNEGKGRIGKGEKRLKKLKTRAKLITIIQKLIDRIPTAGLLYLSRTLQPMIGGNCSTASMSNSSNSSVSKMSPSSTSASSPASAATRLVELQYHQQHVSPRKRILREFEKVSLEDAGTIVGGAKRSRAKGNSANISKSSSSSLQRMQSTNCSLPTSTSMTIVTTANGCFNKSASKPMTCIPSTNSTPTRLYSSYSIHSLLSGGGGNSSSLNSTTVPNSPASTSLGKRATEYATNFSNINYQQQHNQQLGNNYTDPSYLRAMLASPKSPESSCGGGSGSVYVGNNVGGKSPSNFASKKRSPPYSSPLYDNHSRSPNIPTHPSSDYNGQHSPTAASLEPNYKMRYSAIEQNSAATQSNQIHQQQNLYSPYMMSPKYVAAPQASISPNSMTTANTARSPHRTPTFNAHIPTSNASSAVATNCIPTRELSPPRSATAPPRDSTPRTVPKKTASIRRQFASPSIAASPTERLDDQQQQDHKTPLNTSASGTTAASSAPHHQQHSFQTILSNPHHIPGPSPLTASSLHYYMYPPNAGSSSPNAIGSPAISSTSAAVQAAALAAAYIPSVVPPSYYHPYISTLAALRQNPLWMHHYPGATTPLLPPHNSASASQSSSRLSPPFHSFPYNGVGAAATVAAAAAAAAAFGGGGGGPPSHLAQVGLAHQMALPSAMAHHAAAATAFIGGPMHSPRLTDEICARTKAGTKQITPTPIYSSSIKDEHSSDVPLNLSKH